MIKTTQQWYCDYCGNEMSGYDYESSVKIEYSITSNSRHKAIHCTTLDVCKECAKTMGIQVQDLHAWDCFWVESNSKFNKLLNIFKKGGTSNE